MLKCLQRTITIPAVDEKTQVIEDTTFNIILSSGVVQAASGAVGTVSEEAIKTFLAAVEWDCGDVKLIEVEKTENIVETVIK